MDGATPEDVIGRLHRFGLERDRLRSALARRMGITLTDLDALEHLELDGPMPQRALADRLSLTSGAITQLVDRLERSALVQRSPHPSDRRITLVHLTPDAGLPPIPELARYHKEMRAAADAFSSPARDQACAFLATITNAATSGAAALRKS